jgi:redox-sensitive bicupin YhaK (pirin superfamily)
VHLLQIWIFPESKGIEPSYEQTTFSREDKLGRLRLIASHDGRDGSVKINQDAAVYAAVLDPGTEVDMAIRPGRHVWVQVARGEVQLGEYTMKAGDGAAVSDEKKIALAGVKEGEVLLFDLN